MDVLKQLETKLQALVAQRNALKEEVERLRSSQGQELDRLKTELADAQQEAQALRQEREGLRQDVQAILKMVEDLG